MGALSPLYATATPTPSVIPISDGSGTLNDWVDTFINPMTTDQDIIVGGFGGAPMRLGVGPDGYVLTVGSGGIVDWAPGAATFVNPMTNSQDLIVGGISGAPGRLGVGTAGQVLTVGSGGIVDWETPAVAGGTVTTVSVVSANGFAGSVATATTTPAITLTTTITGILSGNGTAISAATTTGSGSVVLATSPTLVTPVLGAATATSIVASGTFTSGAVAGVTGAILLKGLTSGTVTLSTADAAGTWTMKLPTSGGTNLYVLQTDGSGNTSWVAQSGGGSGTVNSGTATNMAYYASTGTAVSGTATVTVSSAGRLGITPTAVSSGVVPYLTITAPADTALTAGTEAIGVSFVGATRQHASNTSITSQREYAFDAPTYSFASATGTITNAATVYISGAPIVGTNAAITNALALWIGGGFLGIGSSGSIATLANSGGTGALRLNAGGTNQNILFVPSGTGIVSTGTASATLPTGVMGTFGTTQATTGLFARLASATAGVSGELLLSHGRGTLASPTALNSGDTLGRVCFGGAAGVAGGWQEFQCLIYGATTEAWSNAASVGCKMVFATTANTTSTRTDALAILPTGQISALVNIASSSTSTGSIISAGGLGVAGAVFTGAAITTGTPSGGTAAAWKFGVLVTAAVTPDVTRYIQLDVGGTLYKLIVST